MYVCMYVCMLYETVYLLTRRPNLCLHDLLCMYACMYSYMYACMYVCMYVNILISIHRVLAELVGLSLLLRPPR